VVTPVEVPEPGDSSGAGDAAGSGAGDSDGGTGNPPGTGNPAVVRNPGAGSGGGATPTNIGPPTDLVLSARRQKLRKALRKGFLAKASCPQGCALKARLVVRGRLAKKYRLARRAKSTVVARGAASVPAGAPKKFRLKFTRKAKRALKRLRSVKLKLVIKPSNANGAGPRKTLSVKLKR
jgi:hypothetical protein